MAQTTFQGPVRSLNGFFSQGPGNVVAVASATLTLVPATHAGRILNITAATTTITLPAAVATADANGTGPGSDPNTLNNMGATYSFYIPAAATAIKVMTPASNFLIGSTILSTAAGASNLYTADGSATRSVNLNGTTTGGIAGSFFTIAGVSSGVYLVQGTLIGSGSLATPFANS
jgi:hypothetical protein